MIILLQVVDANYVTDTEMFFAKEKGLNGTKIATF